MTGFDGVEDADAKGASAADASTVNAGADGAALRRSARRGWGVVAAAFVVMFAAFGCAYAFSAFFASLQESFGASRGALSWAFSIAVCLYFALGAVSGPLADRLGPRGMALFGMAVIGIGFAAMGQARALWQVYAGYGLGIGIGVGFAYVPSVGAVQRWFVRRRGFASGLAVSGIGVGTLVVPKVAEWLIEAQGWRGAAVTLGFLAVLVGGGAALLVDGAPERRGFAPDGGVAGANDAPTAGMALRDVLRSRPFGLLYAASFVVSLGLFVPFVHLVPFVEDRGIAHSTAVTLFTLVGLGSTLGRFCLGGIADRLGRRRSLAGMYLGLALMLAWWLAADSAWKIAVFALVFGTCYGGFVALAPALLVDYFGARNASGVIGLCYTSVGLGTLIGPPLAGYTFDLFGSYALPIAGSAVTALLGAVLVCLMPEPER